MLGSLWQVATENGRGPAKSNTHETRLKHSKNTRYVTL